MMQDSVWRMRMSVSEKKVCSFHSQQGPHSEKVRNLLENFGSRQVRHLPRASRGLPGPFWDPVCPRAGLMVGACWALVKLLVFP